MNQTNDTDEATTDARWHNRLGRLLSSSAKYAAAVPHFEEALRLQPTYAAAHFNLGSALVFQRRQANDDAVCRALDHFRLALVHQPHFPDAHVNLAAQLYARGDYEVALEHALAAVTQDPGNAHGFYNLNTIYRALGQQGLAVQLCWERVRALVGTNVGTSAPPPPQPQPPPTSLSVVCVKWGTKYGPEYVNRLLSGVRRHLRRDFQFHCFTEAPHGLASDVLVHPLREGFTGWWNKAQLFAADSPVHGRVVYIDLDTVVVGDLTALFSYTGNFGTLATDDMHNERRAGGINSSVMIWTAGTCSDIFELLHQHWKAVAQCIYKFDHWLEMVLCEHPVDFLQELYPGHIVEYMQSCQTTCPADARVVCFPLEPKPHAASAPWIRDYWI
ncbi:hypothetical protein ACHHYP_04200 [Achlya hypogyna]|uniref:Uncharacterized protein n=1 Tax=Achlya hypogyna TaxID=1202772 RepID=A0A1V9Z1Y7_ACHHY|nr:hypothetical protein ACHHYP_04200 [Achlya hypogyna]